MASRKGTLLERNVEQLLKLVGLKPELNKIYHGYEIDIFLRYKNKKIAFECKQYEKSALTVRNLIHEWDSKNKELELDKIVLVLFGINITPNDKELAKKYGMIIWGEDKLGNFLNQAIELKEKFLDKLIMEIDVSLDDKSSVTKEINLIKEKLKELVNENKGKTISDDSSQTYPIFFRVSKKNRGYLIISYTRKNGFELMYNENLENLKGDKLEIFEKILNKYSFTERKRMDIKEMQYHIDPKLLTIALGKDLDFANEIITNILTNLSIDNLSELNFKFRDMKGDTLFKFEDNKEYDDEDYEDNTKNSGCLGCCATGLIPTLILFLPFITIFPSKKILLALMNFHQKVTSPKLNKLNMKCRYEPSCSEYGKLAILKHGAIKGGWMSIIRLSHCTPYSNHHLIDYP